MTKVVSQPVKCIRCGKESEQLIVYSVNFNLGSRADNEKLIQHLQECPHCGYKSIDISKENTN